MNISKYNTKKNWIVGGIVLLFLCIGMYFISIRPPKYVKDNISEIKTYQDSISLLKSRIKLNDKFIDSLSKKLVKIDSGNLKIKTKIIYSKQETKIKIDSVSKYTKTDVDSFLISRYKDSTISISQPTGKKIITDLVEGDGAKNDLFLTEEQLKNTENKVDIQSDIINKYKNEKLKYDSILVYNDKKDVIFNNTISLLTKNVKKQKKALFFNKLSSIAIIGTLTYFLITK